ncbi:mediator of RNA polymerase II transcription subunit 1-like isoform X3 [Hemicordylus capensis]|uniref:mediator of RNA polymerase II transcription subunit 1-like isoform X3 n=1 Tax=Hemicordylus capensis TaxID=884348 RepID=UPI002302E4CC|nr:mediator of RNA polymerase II transcription subunit 1-like isoform X3 [Hemicordylus capensis]
MDPVKPASSNAIIETLHLKFSQKPWKETMKLVRLCLDKPRMATSTAASDCPLTTCLEKMQRALNAESLSTVMNRLEFLSKQKGLNSYVGPNGTACYITSEMFYIEINLETDGNVKDVKVAHPGKSPLTCADLLQLLRARNYDAFGKILEKLLNLYQIPGSSETKMNIYIALSTLEKDLFSLSALNRLPGMDRVAEILYGKVGYLRPRTGGIPMSLEFWLSPYQILEEQLNPGQMCGMKVFLTMGVSDAKHTFPLAPLLVNPVTGDDGSRNFLPLTEVVCVDLSACFFLKFWRPFPMFLSSIHELQKLTGIPMDKLKPAPLHELIVQHALSEKCKDDLTMNSSFIVSLPDCQKHSYFIDNTSKRSDLTGAIVGQLPFLHPKCVPDMIEILRHQAAYNTLISSCTSANIEHEDSSELLYFEVSQQKFGSFSITFKHPLEENLACVVINVLSSREVGCTLHTVSDDGALNCSNDFLTKVLKRCMSVPVLMRAIFKKLTQQKVDEAMQSSEGTSEQKPKGTYQSKVSDSSGNGLQSAGASNCTEESLSETSRQASFCNSMEENGSVEPLDDSMEENISSASLQLSSDTVEETTSVSLDTSSEDNHPIDDVQASVKNTEILCE